MSVILQDDKVIASSTEDVAAGTVYKTLTDDVGGYTTGVVFVDLDAISAGDDITFQVQDSADGTNYADISGANFGGALTTAAVYRQALTQFARYLRAKVTLADTGGGGCSATYDIRVHLKTAKQ